MHFILKKFRNQNGSLSF